MKYYLIVCMLFSFNCLSKITTTYYFGEEVKKDLNGKKISSSIRIVKRVEDHDEKKITENFTFQDKNKIKHITFYMNYDESKKMTLTSTAGILKGTGVLFGTPNQRNGWSANLSYSDGSQIKFIDSVINGDVYSAFNYFDKDGSLIATSNTIYRNIQKESYELLKKKLLTWRSFL